MFLQENFINILCFHICILEPCDFILFSAHKKYFNNIHIDNCVLESIIYYFAAYIHSKIYFIGYVLMYTVKHVDFLLAIFPERDKFAE